MFEVHELEGDGVRLVCKDYAGGGEGLAALTQVRALLATAPRRIAVDMRALRGFDAALESFARAVLQPVSARIIELVYVGGDHDAKWAAGAAAAYLGAPFVFRETPPAWAAPPTRDATL